jgi:hypothetical protein
MTTKDDILGYLEDHKSKVSLIQEFLKDSNISLEERWDVYLKVANLLPIGFDSDLDSVGIDSSEFSIDDDFYEDRYSTVNYEYVVYKILNRKQNATFGKWWELDLDSIKEKILVLGLQGFVYDW